MSGYSVEQVREEVDILRARLNTLREALSAYFVDKEEIIDLMVICTLAQEPLLLVGRPGTAKSDLIVKFCQALGLKPGEYFEYMLTKFTEPGEIIGPIDIDALKGGRYLRRVSGKMPEARIVFLDEIFKSNSAILNTLLTMINERKYYQDGQPTPVAMKMLFAATNEIPEFTELDALKDRFTLKVESRSVRSNQFEALLNKGLRNSTYKAFNQRPWQNLASLEDFEKLKLYLDTVIMNGAGDDDELHGDQVHYFPDEVFALFRRVLRTLEKEDDVEISDRKVIKLYRLIRARAFLFHGGVVQREDLSLLRYIPERLQDFQPIREKVDNLLRL
ncbi:MAG: AAA family ATPase [Myxococcota bacterium]